VSIERRGSGRGGAGAIAKPTFFGSSVAVRFINRKKATPTAVAATPTFAKAISGEA
jgi:hypothetical protein